MRVSDWSSDVCASDLFAARQRALELADLVIERKTLFMLDQRDHPADQFGPLGVALQAANLVEDSPVAHHREPRPVAKVGEIAAGDLENLVERAIMAALAEQRQHEPVDDAIIERSEEHTSELQSLMRT